MDLPVLTPGQFDLVSNGFSLAIAAMGAGFIYFVLVRGQVAPAYRMALTVSALVVAIAFYHYIRIFESWAAAYVLEGGMYVASGKPFNDAYRYVDWLLTVPLLLTEAVLVLRLKKGSGGMIARLSIAAVLMIVTGYPGEVATDTATRLIWGTISTIPFLYILYVLWVELGRSLPAQPEKVRVLVRNLRLLLLATWGVYPIAYLAPVFGFDGAGAAVALQTGYTIADVLAKPFFGAMIVWIAFEKTRADGWQPADARGSAAGAAAD
ncbi:MAG: xanthorhodopsin [Trueperaceae bacterium]|nr:MAG: xanthorhodopsin [Trueperaceae bacterium]